MSRLRYVFLVLLAVGVLGVNTGCRLMVASLCDAVFSPWSDDDEDDDDDDDEDRHRHRTSRYREHRH